MQRFLTRVEKSLARDPGAFEGQLYHKWVAWGPRVNSWALHPFQESEFSM